MKEIVLIENALKERLEYLARELNKDAQNEDTYCIKTNKIYSLILIRKENHE